MSVHPVFSRAAPLNDRGPLDGELIVTTSPIYRIALIVVTLLVVVALVIGATASFARKETVAGTLAPSGGVIRVLASQAGVIETMLTSQGSTVTAGDKLAGLRVSQTAGSGDLGQAMAVSLNSEGLAQEANAAATRRRQEMEEVQLVNQLADLAMERAEAAKRVEFANERRKVAQGDLDRAEALRAKGYMSELAVNGRRTAILSADEGLSASRSELMQLERQLSQTRSQRLLLQTDKSGAEAARASAAASLQQRGLTLEGQDRYFATAPVAGNVSAVAVSTGQSVAAGTTLVIITPKASHLQAELFVPSRAIGFVHLGQEVRLMYGAFPYQKFGTGLGIVSAISDAALSPGDLAAATVTVQEPVYRVVVELRRPPPGSRLDLVQLRSGMSLTADLVNERRTLFAWLFEPLLGVEHRQ
jgi:membrane fusion protein